MKNLKLSLRLLSREWRSGELRILVFALVTAVAATATIGFFTERLNRAMLRQSAELIGGDLVLNSSRPITSAWLEEGRGRGLAVSQQVSFTSALVYDEEFVLSSVKAVDASYPLRGNLRVADEGYGSEYEIASGPQPGTLWVDQRVLTRLNVSVGAKVQLGNESLRIAQLLTFEPDRGGNLFNLAPRVLMHYQDLEEVGVLTTGSRADYSFTFAGDASSIASLSDWLEARLRPEHRLLNVHSGDDSGNRALKRAEEYLRLTSMLAVLLAAVAIVMATRRYSERHYDVSAMFRCLGAQQRDILAIYLFQLVSIAILSGLAGATIGWAAHWLLHELLEGLLATRLPAPSLFPALVGFTTGVIILAGTALPPILRLKAVPPLRVLRRSLIPLPTSAWLVYLVAWAALVLLIILLSENLMFSIAVFAGIGLIAGCLLIIVRAVFKFTRDRQAQNSGWFSKGLVRLARRSSANAGQVIAFGVTITLMLVIGLLRTDLLEDWAEQLPPDAPNHFAYNILPQDQAALSRFLSAESLSEVPLYPMVRARLTAVNDAPLQADPDTGERGEGQGPQRELNLTWMTDLPEDNRIIAGGWWDAADQGTALVSLEAEFAERIGATLGDSITLDIVGNELAAQVKSIRTLNWESFTPNFYIAFPPGTLDGFPTTYVTSFRLAKSDEETLPELVKRFPATSVIEVEVILEQLRRILQQVTLAVEIMLLFVLAAGFAVLFAAIQTSVDDRMHEGALMRVMGASRAYLRSANLTEFALLGFISGLLAVFSAEMISFIIYTRIFGITWTPNLFVWPLVPLLTAALIGVAGYGATHRSVTKSPSVILRKY